MLIFLAKRFIPERFFLEDDVEALRRANALIYLSAINVLLGSIFILLDLSQGQYPMALVNSWTTAMMFIVPFWLRKGGSVWWPAQMQIVALYVSIGALNVVNGGFSKIYLMPDILLPLYAVFLMSTRVGVFWAFMVTAKVILFLYLTKSGVILFPKSAEPGQDTWAAAVITLSFLSTGFAGLFAHLKDEAFTRLKKANEDLEVARAEAVQASLAKSEFLANMSHEIRTPLNAIIGYSEILQEDVADLGDESLSSDLDKICSSSHHLLSLINDILDLSKIEAGKMERFVEPFEFQGWFEALVASATALIKKNDNEFAVTNNVSLDVVHSDPTRLRQVVENLLSNAGKFTKEGKVSLRVSSELREEKPWLVFEVKDSGIGITEEQRNILFQKFTQAEASTSKRYGGTGLGLALCKEFCNMLEGDISVESNPGEGSLFRVEVPADLPYVEPRNFTPASLNRVEMAHDELVLLIDDDEACHDMLQRYLSRHGYRIMSAFEGETGLKLAREHHPSAILLDVCMPGLDGWDVLGELKADPEVADIPVVLVTIVDEVQKGFALGASEFMLKPFQQKELREILLRFRKAKNDFTVLVVEDDDAIRELVVRMLRKEGCTVHEASNGKEGLDVLKDVELPGLVITDLVMPELDGFSFLSAIRKDNQLAGIPVVVMTAKELSQDERDTLDGSVERVLTKDAYHLQELLEALCQQMQSLLNSSKENETSL